MIKDYKLKGISFKTLIIPRGTILFRGINFEDETKYTNIFEDLIGYRTEKYYGIDPNMNVFFYPVPYISDSVKVYDIHVMYVTQYDIELLLLINPSNISRENKNNDIYNDIFRTCMNISNKNKCGQDMSIIDPCLSDDVRKRFPQIDGYIAISNQDSAVFYKKYQDMIDKNQLDKVKQILPSILINSSGNYGIPEIVIHPLRFRQNNCVLHLFSFKTPVLLI